MSCEALAYARHGHGGEPLLLLHAGPDAIRRFARCAPRLAQAGFDAIAPQLPRDSGSEDESDLRACSGALYALLHDRLRVERVTAAGGGFAAAIARDLSLRFPGYVERLVLWDRASTEPGEPTPCVVLEPSADEDLVGAILRVAAPRHRDPWPDAETAFVGLGSNLGDRERHLCAAAAALRTTEGIRDVVVSPIYESRAEGPGRQGPYLNAVARLETRLPPQALLQRLLAIEREQGRVRADERNAARTLDLDLLLFGSRRVDDAGLVIPHPRLQQRPFVLDPLCDLAPQLVHPLLGQAIEALAKRVRDSAVARRRDV
ncbi:MAG TPA: 2-amino-4-hydroxy-6-hydroxymethyldihydropteridine diphosphokinase [Myxococcota bacterium]|nr:2-amino-4-hydroxy-6-hydroxymethyldihydropteridine diphosphokinase [Myxococcota bacterium]